MKTIICTAADHRFFDLLMGLIRSIRDKPEGRGIGIGVLDLGLTVEQRQSLAPLISHFAEPGWDMAFPEGSLGPTHAAKDGYKAMTARPFLPRYFPGYDIYIWIDADAWIQDWEAIDCLERAASWGEIAIIPEMDRAYRTSYDYGRKRRWMRENYRRFFGEEAARKFRHMPVLNSGVFALRRDAPHWQAWATDFQAGLLRQPDLTVEQTALNFTLYSRRLPHHFLPARFNWLVNKATPKFDLTRKLFTEPLLPHQPLGIIHLSGRAKDIQHMVWTTDSSGQIGTKLRYNPARRQPTYRFVAAPTASAGA